MSSEDARSPARQPNATHKAVGSPLCLIRGPTSVGELAFFKVVTKLKHQPFPREGNGLNGLHFPSPHTLRPCDLYRTRKSGDANLQREPCMRAILQHRSSYSDSGYAQYPFHRGLMSWLLESDLIREWSGVSSRRSKILYAGPIKESVDSRVVGKGTVAEGLGKSKKGRQRFLCCTSHFRHLCIFGVYWPLGFLFKFQDVKYSISKERWLVLWITCTFCTAGRSKTNPQYQLARYIHSSHTSLRYAIKDELNWDWPLE